MSVAGTKKDKKPKDNKTPKKGGLVSTYGFETGVREFTELSEDFPGYSKAEIAQMKAAIKKGGKDVPPMPSMSDFMRRHGTQGKDRFRERLIKIGFDKTKADEITNTQHKKWQARQKPILPTVPSPGAKKARAKDLAAPLVPGRVSATDIRTTRRMKEISERAKKGAEVDRRMERLEAETGVVTPSGMVIPSKPTVIVPGVVRPKPISTEAIISGMGKQPISAGRTPLDRGTYDVNPWKERPGKPMMHGGKLMTDWYGEWVGRSGNLADKKHWGLGWIRKDAVSKFESRFKTEAKKKGWVDPSLRRPSVTAIEGREAMTVLEKRRIEAERGMVTGKRGKKYDADLARKLSEAKIKRGEVVVERGKTWIIDPISGERVLAPKGMRVTGPAAREVSRLERKRTFTPMTEEEKDELRRRRDQTYKDMQRQAALYTDAVKAARFMAIAMKGRRKKIPTHGYSIHKIEQAYRKKEPRGMWKIKIRRDRPREMIYIKIIAPNTYVKKRTGETVTTFPYSESIENEFVKILELHGMILYPGEKVVSHRRPKVGKGFINLHLRAKVYKPSEQRVRP